VIDSSYQFSRITLPELPLPSIDTGTMRPLVGIQRLSLWTDSDHERLRRIPIFQGIIARYIFDVGSETAALEYRLWNLLIER
jgi:hypothetical protein